MALVQVLQAPASVPASTTTKEIAVPAGWLPAPAQRGWWASWRYDSDRKKLKRTLARIIQICQDHEANGVKNGSPIFQTLYDKASSHCDTYCQKWNVDRKLLEVELPALRVLRLAGYPAPNVVQKQSNVVLIVGILAVLTLPWLIGAWTGLFGSGQHWIHKLVGG